MHANKGSRKLQSSGHSVVKTVTKPTSDESEQKYEGEKSSVKKAGRMRKDVGSLHRSGIHVKRVLSGKISRRSLNGFVSKSVRNSGQHRLGHRPRRNVIHRTWDYTAGLSWKEEKELKKALMASLQESKKSNKQSNEHNSESSNSNADVMQNKGERKQKMLKLQIPQPREASNQTESSTKNTNLNYQVQVRAQRKFAQGSRPCSPGCSPLKGRSLHSKALVTKKAKTEDFLTFLCLRGTTTLPPHLDFSNNFMECESLSSFPNTPRHSQDGSRPETPVTAGSNHGNNSRGTDDTSRSGSPDVEIALESADLGVKPLVGASGRAAMVTGGVGSATSTRACTYLTNRCATATRCTTNAMSFSDSNSSFSTSTATSSSASTPSPVDCSLGGTTGLNPHGTDYASVSANSRHQYHMAAEDVRTDVVCRRYITRGKQKSIQESIAAKGHCSSLGAKCAMKANEVNDFSNRRISPRGAERVDKLLLKKMVPKVKDKTREPKDCKRSCSQRHRLAGCETCMYAFPEESRHEKHVLKKQSKSRTKGKAPTIARPFKGSRKEESSKSSYYVTRMGSGEKAHSRPCAQTRRVIAAESQQEDEEDEDGCNDDDDNNDGGHDDGDEGISESLNFRVDIATQTSDTSSYTAEIDIDFLLDDNSDTDVSEDEVSSDDKLDVDDACETEQVGMSSTGPKEDCKEGSSPDTTQNIAPAYTAETYQGTPVVSQDLVSMETSTATSEPIVSFTGCPISAMRPFSQSQPITVNYSEPVSTTTNVAQPAMITYSGNTFPLQTCTMVGQNLILDENARSMLLNDAPTQVVNNMSIQMQGFSVQQGLSTLPVDNISGLSYIHPALNVGTGPSQSLLPNTIATIDNPLATSPVAVVPNQGLALQGSQSLQVNLSNVAIGTRCASGKPELSTSMPVHLCPARSLANILPKILPGPSSTPMGTMFTKCVTSALSPAPVTHLAASITCAAAVKLLDVRATGSVSLPPLVAPVVSCAGSLSLPPRVAPVVSCASPSAAFRAVSSRFLLAAQRPISALCPLPPPVMAPGFYQPMETPENSPMKSNPVIQVEPDTTVIDERSVDQSRDVIVLSSMGENTSQKNELKKQLSPSKIRQNKSKSPDKTVLKRKLSKPDNHVSPGRGYSPTKKSPKKPCSKETQRSLRFGSKRSGEVEDTVDLTGAEEQTRKNLMRRTRAKADQRTINKRSLSPVEDSDLEQSASPSSSPRRRLRTDSLMKQRNKAKESPDRNRLSLSRRHSIASHDDLQDSSSKRSHLRSSSHHNMSPRAVSSSRLSGVKKAVDSDVMTRSKTGTIPKAAIPAGFPKPDDPAHLVEVPTYHPSTEQFQDPIAYLDSIWRDAEPYGMCRIVPPDGWKPECDISEELRFTTQVQYIHKMADRWGVSVKQFECIKHHLKSQGINMEQSPCVGGVELDLPSVSAAIRSQGGLQCVINKNKWLKVAENMKIPKAGQERISRLYEIYCKYLLSYDTLSQEEKERLEQEVENKHMKGTKHLDQSCTSKGRSKPLSEFFRVARNTQSIWFNEDEPTADQVEELYWQLVNERDQHVSIQVAHIDTKHCGSAFPAKKDSPYARHGWNYNILQHHPSSVLRHLGQVTGLTVPMLHIGMVFSTSCWARDPHFLPYMVYSHTGADVIWYCVPKSEEAKFKAAFEDVAPKLIDAQSPIWLPEDSVMIDPKILLEHGVSYCRTVQNQGEFVVVFPKAFTATVTCGYNISESLHFATAKWLPLGYEAAQLLYASGEPDLFSMEKLLFLLATDDKTPTESLQILLPLLEKAVEEELHLRKRLGEAGLQQAKKVSRNEVFLTGQDRPRRSVDLTSHEENRCDSSCKICFFSTVVNEAEHVMFALQDALLHIKRKKNLRNCKLLYRFDQKELKDLIQQVKTKVTCGRSSTKRKSSKAR